MQIIVVGAGHVGTTIVEALHDDHDVAVVDLDPRRLQDLSYAYDVRTVTGNGASRRALQEAGVETADLVLASTAVVEANLVAAMLVRRLSKAATIVRTTDEEYLESWREGLLDVDYVVSSEIETAHEISSAITVPAARTTEMFADGQVQIVEFDIPREGAGSSIVGRPLADADLPPDSTVACIIRAGAIVPADAHAEIRPGDRLIIIGSPDAARAWSRHLSPGDQPIDDVVIFGAGRAGGTVARELLDRRIRVRIVEPDAERAQRMAADRPRARVFHATGADRQFLQRERIGQAAAVVTATGNDARSLYLAVLARSIGVPYTLGVVDDPMSVGVFEQAGVNVAVNPRNETAEAMIRFAHDPRTRQVAMLDDDRFEVIDIAVREESAIAGLRLRDMPKTGSVIGAIVRDGVALFPVGDDVLRPDDRVVILIEAVRAAAVERAL